MRILKLTELFLVLKKMNLNSSGYLMNMIGTRQLRHSAALIIMQWWFVFHYNRVYVLLWKLTAVFFRIFQSQYIVILLWIYQILHLTFYFIFILYFFDYYIINYILCYVFYNLLIILLVILFKRIIFAIS